MEKNTIENNITPKINSQEEFQKYYEDGISKTKTLKEFNSFIENSKSFKYELKMTPTLLLIALPKATELTVGTLLEAFSKIGHKE